MSLGSPPRKSHRQMNIPFSPFVISVVLRPIPTLTSGLFALACVPATNTLHTKGKMVGLPKAKEEAADKGEAQGKGVRGGGRGGAKLAGKRSPAGRFPPLQLQPVFTATCPPSGGHFGSE